MRETLDIVYASDQTYLFFCCVSILSLMEQLPENQKVRLHLLLDESFSEEDRRLLNYLTDSYKNLKLSEHRISEAAFDSRDFKDSLWSKAACYRLILPMLLPDVDICLYIDSDTLVVGDILPLWETDMTDYYLAGVFDDISPVREQTVRDNIPDIQTYINSGVLLMNLSLMRRHGIQKKLMKGIQDYLVVDQDLLNVVCYGRIRLLPSDYNCIPGVFCDTPRILHFLMRDYIRPWKNLRAEGSDLWWRCAERFEGLYDINGLREKADWYEMGSLTAMLRRSSDYERIYVVGSGMDAQRIYRALRLGRLSGLQKLLKEDDPAPDVSGTLLIVATKKKKIPIVQSFLKESESEGQVFYFAKWPISFYRLLPRNCAREVNGELLMWEYGADSKGTASMTLLLEISAARFPEREALTEWRDGAATSVSWKELNRMANRMADKIRRQNIRRGSVIRLGSDGRKGISFLAGMLGIMKSGCIAAMDENDDYPCVSIPKEGEYLSDNPPLEVLPDEPLLIEDTAVALDNPVWTGRRICEMAEVFRRRTGWHGKDRLMICQGESSLVWVLLAAAFYEGSPVTFVCDDAMGDFLTAAKEKNVTVIFSENSVLKRTLYRREKETLDPGCLRMLITETFWKAPGRSAELDEGEIAAKWHALVPSVPVNGQGYEGSFCYDSEWY